jgi:hypothetical protein
MLKPPASCQPRQAVCHAVQNREGDVEDKGTRGDI